MKRYGRWEKSLSSLACTSIIKVLRRCWGSIIKALGKNISPIGDFWWSLCILACLLAMGDPLQFPAHPGNLMLYQLLPPVSAGFKEEPCFEAQKWYWVQFSLLTNDWKRTSSCAADRRELGNLLKLSDSELVLGLNFIWFSLWKYLLLSLIRKLTNGV